MQTLIGRDSGLTEAIFVVLISTLVLAGVGSYQDTDAGAEPNPVYVRDFASLAKQVAPVVVNISTTEVIKRRESPFASPFGDDSLNEFWRKFFGDPRFGGPLRRQGLGSGFIIDGDGTILTNNHVIENAEKIIVKLQDNREFDGKVLGKDPKTDIAVIKIDVK